MKKSIFIIALLFIASIGTYAQTFKVIVNSGNGTSSISKKEASDFFLKKKNKWSDGTAVLPVDLTAGSKVREDFSQQVHGKNTAAIRNFWQQAAFSGSGTAPVEKTTDDDVIEYVKKNRGAIGYISASASSSGLKVLIIN